MKTEYVSYEIAKQLKKLGFDEPSIVAYDEVTMACTMTGSPFKLLNYNSPSGCGYVSAPLWQQAREWIAKVHDLDIIIEPYWNSEYQEKNYLVRNTVDVETHSNFHCYDDALIRGMERAIILIQKKLKLNGR